MPLLSITKSVQKIHFRCSNPNITDILVKMDLCSVRPSVTYVMGWAQSDPSHARRSRTKAKKKPTPDRGVSASCRLCHTSKGRIPSLLLAKKKSEGGCPPHLAKETRRYSYSFSSLLLCLFFFFVAGLVDDDDDDNLLLFTRIVTICFS